MTVTYDESYEGQIRKSVGSRKLILPSVRAVIRDEVGRVLLVRRSDDGAWVMPAGSLEMDEAPVDALRREVREETGLEALPPDLCGFEGIYRQGDHEGAPEHLASGVSLGQENRLHAPLNGAAGGA